MSKIRVNELETIDGISTKEVGKLFTTDGGAIEGVLSVNGNDVFTVAGGTVPGFTYFSSNNTKFNDDSDGGRFIMIGKDPATGNNFINCAYQSTGAGVLQFQNGSVPIVSMDGSGLYSMKPQAMSPAFFTRKDYVDTLVANVDTRGEVKLWYGKLIDIPSGWAICDGTKGTPELEGLTAQSGEVVPYIMYIGVENGS